MQTFFAARPGPFIVTSTVKTDQYNTTRRPDP